MLHYCYCNLKIFTGHFLLPEDPLRPDSCSWICRMFRYGDNPTISKSDGNHQLAEPKEILHRVEPKAVNQILERLKRMVSQTDLTNIKVNLTLLGTESHCMYQNVYINPEYMRSNYNIITYLSLRCARKRTTPQPSIFD